jgi:copper(I)-binding protein
MKTLALGAALLASLAGIAQAQTPTISVENAWARPTVPAVKTGAVYVTILDHGAPDRLVAVSTPVAGEAQLHETIKDGSVMKMRPVDGLAIPRDQPVAFAPGGYHIMLTNLKQPLTAGAHFPLSLKFQNAGTVETMVTVQAGATPAMTMGAGAHEMPMNMPMTPPAATKP